MDQPGKVANLAHGQLNREENIFPCSCSRLRFWCLLSTPIMLNLILTHGNPPDFRGGVLLLKPTYAIGSVPSLSGHAIAYLLRSLPRVRQRASSPQGNSSNGCFLFKYHHGPMSVRFSFLTPTYWYEVGILEWEVRVSRY